MASTPDLGTSPAADTCGGELLPLSPYDSLKYHFGMLLGVDDLNGAAYHRAKIDCQRLAPSPRRGLGFRSHRR